MTSLLRAFFLFVHIFQSEAAKEKHYLQYEFTVKTKADNFPEFSAVAESDGIQISYYCNEKQEWIKVNLTDEWNKAPIPPESREYYTTLLHNLTRCEQHASKCSELHVLQRIVGCELEKQPNGTEKKEWAFDNYGFDGEDQTTFTSKVDERLQPGNNPFFKHFLKSCIDWINTFDNKYKRSPKVYLLGTKVPDDNSKINLTCLATDFYPGDIEMQIRHDKTRLDFQDSSGVRPNNDNTFQKEISVTIDRNNKGSYDCLTTHSSLTELLSVEWDGKCSNCDPKPQRSAVAGVGLLVGLLIIFLLLFLYWICYKRNSQRRLL